MRYEQSVVIYGTVVVEAENIEKGKQKVNEILADFKHKHDHLIDEGLIVGDIDRPTDIFGK